MEALKAAARHVEQQRRRTRVGSTVGLLQAKAQEFAETGIPRGPRPPPSEPTPREKALDEKLIREGARERVAQYRHAGVDWPEVILSIERDLRLGERLLDLTDDEKALRRGWANEEIDAARVQDERRKAAIPMLAAPADPWRRPRPVVDLSQAPADDPVIKTELEKEGTRLGHGGGGRCGLPRAH